MKERWLERGVYGALVWVQTTERLVIAHVTAMPERTTLGRLKRPDVWLR